MDSVDALLLYPFTPLIEFFFFFFFFFLGETSTIGGCFLWVCCSGIGIYKMFKMIYNHSDVGISYSCQILLLYGAKTNKTLV